MVFNILFMMNLLAPCCLSYEALIPEQLPFFQEKRVNGSVKAPAIECQPQKIDFGKVLGGERPVTAFRIINNGKKDIVLLKIAFTCGCTIPQIVLPSGKTVVPDKKGESMIGILGPGEHAELKLQMKTFGITGRIRRKLTIYSDDPGCRSLEVPVLAEVKTAFTFEPRFISFGRIRKNQCAFASVTIRSIQAGEFEITGLKGLPSYYSYSIKRFKEGEICCACFDLSLADNAPVGPQNLRLKFEVKNEKVKEFELSVYGEVLPPVVFDTGSKAGRDIIDFGILQKGKGAEKEIDIINHDPDSPYIVSKMQLSSPYSDFLDIKLVSIETGVRYKLKVSVKPGLNEVFFSGDIVLSSNHPDLEKKVLSIKGWVRDE